MIIATVDWWLDQALIWNQFVLSSVQTTAVVVTAVFAILYTRATVKLLAAANKQADAAAKQSGLAADQLQAAKDQARLMNDQLKLSTEIVRQDQEERERASEPYFAIRSAGGGVSTAAGIVSCQFRVLNMSAPVYAVWVESKSPLVEADYDHGLHVFSKESDETRFSFSATNRAALPPSWEFWVHFRTMRHAKRQHRFVATGEMIKSLDHEDLVAVERAQLTEN